MGNYNYSGHWHQDLLVPNTGVQISIIFKDEKGFKILKKQKNSEFFDKEIFKIFSDHAKKHTLPIVLEEEYYDSLNLEVGDIFLFDPSLLHKGSCNYKRLLFHMRFFNFDINKNYKKLQLKDFDFFFDADKTSERKYTPWEFKELAITNGLGMFGVNLAGLIVDLNIF